MRDLPRAETPRHRPRAQIHGEKPRALGAGGGACRKRRVRRGRHLLHALAHENPGVAETLPQRPDVRKDNEVGTIVASLTHAKVHARQRTSARGRLPACAPLGLLKDSGIVAGRGGRLKPLKPPEHGELPRVQVVHAAIGSAPTIRVLEVRKKPVAREPGD